MWVRRSFKATAGLAMLAVPLFLAGCDECWDDDCCNGWGGDDEAPSVPVGVTSVTGDGEVYLEWFDVQDRDLAGYRVYVSDRLDGGYESIGETGNNHFVDHGVRNGKTYYYAVVAYDHCDNESDLSYETVHDTPRPEGFDLVLFAADTRPADAGYDFSGFRCQGPDAPGTDIYYRFTGGVPWMYTTGSGTQIQDVGFLRLDELDWAPARGWSELGRVELIAGHTYVVLTRDDHYAKFHVDSVNGDRVTLDWAYQIDRGNRELSVGAPVASASAVDAGSRKREDTGVGTPVSAGGK